MNGYLRESKSLERAVADALAAFPNTRPSTSTGQPQKDGRAALHNRVKTLMAAEGTDYVSALESLTNMSLAD